MPLSAVCWGWRDVTPCFRRCCFLNGNFFVFCGGGVRNFLYFVSGTVAPSYRVFKLEQFIFFYTESLILYLNGLPDDSLEVFGQNVFLISV